jgi:amidase
VCSPELHPEDKTYTPRDNEFDAYNWSKYDPVAFVHAPVSLQVVGKKWDCERVMKAAGMVADVMAGRS